MKSHAGMLGRGLVAAVPPQDSPEEASALDPPVSIPLLGPPSCLHLSGDYFRGAFEDCDEWLHDELAPSQTEFAACCLLRTWRDRRRWDDQTGTIPFSVSNTRTYLEMGWFASLYDWMMQGVEEDCLREWRGDLLAGAEGRVLEIGGGTGANLEAYPEAVTELVVVEPDDRMRAALRGKLSECSGYETRLVEGKAERLPFEESTFDTAVSTLVLCSVQDPEVALGEIRRVLRPGGRFLFLEHVAAVDHPGRRRWQTWIEPVWKRLLGNCHLTRETGQNIRQSGFVMDRLSREEMCRAPGIVRPTVRGVAHTHR